MTRSIKVVAAKEIVAQHSVELSDVLEVAGTPEGDGDTQVDQALVTDALDLVPIDEQEDNRANQPAQPTRLIKSQLADINRRARKMHESLTFPKGTMPDADRRPEKVGKGRIRFWVQGNECYMVNTEYAKALQNLIPFEAPKPSRQEKQKLAEELKQVIFALYPNCALCGVEIDDYGPEEAMVNQMINGGVLSESGLRPRRTKDEFQINIRRLDIFCRFWDDAYSDMVIELSVDPDLDVDKYLMGKSQLVTDKICEKRPDVTEFQVLLKLKTIHANLRGLKAIGEQPE